MSFSEYMLAIRLKKTTFVYRKYSCKELYLYIGEDLYYYFIYRLNKLSRDVI
jgi:hypothetical protein